MEEKTAEQAFLKYTRLTQLSKDFVQQTTIYGRAIIAELAIITLLSRQGPARGLS